MLLVFGPRRGPDGQQRAARQCRFQQVGGIAGAMQLLRQQRPAADAVWVVAANDEAHALAVVVALLLNQRGQAARYWYGADVPNEGHLVVVGEGEVELGHIGERLVGKVPTLGDHEHAGLVSLLTSDHLPWQTAV